MVQGPALLRASAARHNEDSTLRQPPAAQVTPAAGRHTLQQTASWPLTRLPIRRRPLEAEPTVKRLVQPQVKGQPLVVSWIGVGLQASARSASYRQAAGEALTPHRLPDSRCQASCKQASQLCAVTHRPYHCAAAVHSRVNLCLCLQVAAAVKEDFVAHLRDGRRAGVRVYELQTATAFERCVHVHMHEDS